MTSVAAARAVAAHASFCEHVETGAADDYFRVSAMETARALMSGVPATRLAALFARSNRHLKAAANAPVYRSVAAVGYHARTGKLLLKPEPAAPVCAREVQTLVKAVGLRCGTRAVDRALRRSTTQLMAFMALRQTLQNWQREAAKVTWCLLDQLEEELSEALDEVEVRMTADSVSADAVNRLYDLARCAEDLWVSQRGVGD